MHITTDLFHFFHFYQKFAKKTVHNQPHSYLHVDGRLSKLQSGNIKWYSTETSVIETANAFGHCWGLSFISERFKEWWKPLNVLQLIPSAGVSCGPPRYCPLRLDPWQYLYHQAPLYVSAQELLQISLSWSLVENCIPLWNEKKRQ